MINETKIEGYWYSDYTPEYPKPIPNVLSNEEAIEIYNKIVDKQSYARKFSFRGTSKSRITGERLGNHEYQLGNWKWTGDLAKHYVLDHKVRPSDDFLEFLDSDIYNSHSFRRRF